MRPESGPNSGSTDSSHWGVDPTEQIYHIPIADLAVISTPGTVLASYSLGSDLAVTLYDPESQVSGMVHAMLPVSREDPQKAASSPATFVDSGLRLLLDRLESAGAATERLVTCVVGGSTLEYSEGYYSTGRKNFTIARKILWKNNILIDATDVGGSKIRSVFLDTRSGRITVSTGLQEKNLT